MVSKKSKSKKIKSKSRNIKKKIEKRYESVKVASNLSPVVMGVGLSSMVGFISRYLTFFKVIPGGNNESWRYAPVIFPLGLGIASMFGAVVTGKQRGIFFGALTITSFLWAYFNWKNFEKNMRLTQMKVNTLQRNLRQQKQRKRQPRDGWQKMSADLKSGNSFSKGTMIDKMVRGEYSDGIADSDMRTSQSYAKYPSGKSYPFKRENPVHQTITSLSNPRRLTETVDVIP